MKRWMHDFQDIPSKQRAAFSHPFMAGFAVQNGMEQNGKQRKGKEWNVAATSHQVLCSCRSRSLFRLRLFLFLTFAWPRHFHRNQRARAAVRQIVAHAAQKRPVRQTWPASQPTREFTQGIHEKTWCAQAGAADAQPRRLSLQNDLSKSSRRPGGHMYRTCMLSIHPMTPSMHAHGEGGEGVGVHKHAHMYASLVSYHLSTGLV